jgi:trk system potassium uptake protein TrkH
MALFEYQEKRAVLHRVLDLVELFIGATCLILLAWEFGSTRWGKSLSAPEKALIETFDRVIVLAFLGKYLLSLLAARGKVRFIRSYITETAVLALLLLVSPFAWVALRHYVLTGVKIFFGVLYPFRIILQRIASLRVNTPLVVAFSFLTLIVAGTVVLSLPKAVVSGEVDVLTSFFTATSATCVTGLSVVNIGTHFTPAGQVAILVLIQLGGLGLMTFVAFFIFAFRSRIAFKGELIIRDALSLSRVSALGNVILFIIAGTFVVESAGAAIMYFNFPFPADWSVGYRIFFSVFHSISAFCNAGLSLLPDSFASVRGSLPLNLIASLLIVAGGLGFAVNMNIARYVKSIFGRKGAPKVRQFGLQTRIVVLATIVLLASGTLVIYLLESSNAFREFSAKEKVLAAVFQSVSARTAGFSTVDFGSLSNATCLVIILLMFIGASPGSTGGGVKTSTFFVLILTIVTRLRNRESVEVFKRTLPQSVIANGLTILAISVLVVFASSLALSITDKGFEFLRLLFESVSAFGTVGYSTGITAALSAAGKIVLILTMFIGRIGPLTIVLSMSRQAIPKKYEYPQETVMMG